MALRSLVEIVLHKVCLFYQNSIQIMENKYVNK